jgi:hypothetical protein
LFFHFLGLGGPDLGFVYFLALDCRQIVDIAIMKSSGHAVLDAFGFTIAQVALRDDAFRSIEMDTAEGAGVDAHLATHTHRFVHHHGTCIQVTADSPRGTNFQANGGFALLAGQGKNRARIHIDVDPNIGILAHKAPGILKRADPLAIPAGQATILFNENDFHNGAPMYQY